MKKTKKLFSIIIVMGLMVSSLIFVLACGGGKTKYTINFETNGGSAVESIVLEEGADLVEPEEPTKDGYNFGGWYLDAALTEDYTFESKMPAKSFNLYARWDDENLLTLKFDSQGGTAVANIKAEATDPIQEPDYPTKNDRVFAGWYLDRAYTQAFDFVMPAFNATVYAKWLKLEEKTSIDINKNWASGDSKAYEITTSGTSTTIKALEGKGTYSTIGTKIAQNVKSYGAFVMTFTGTQGEEFLLKCQNGGVTAKEVRVKMNGKENQKFVWTVDAANLTNGAVAMDFYIFLRPGVAGVGENGASLTVKELKLFRVRGESDAYQSVIFFDSQGGTAVDSIFAPADTNVTKPTTIPTKAGYTFENWYKDSECTQLYSFDKMADGVTYVYANWIQNADATISFDLNGGTGTANAITMPGGSNIAAASKPANPEKDGYLFDNWYSDSEFTTVFNWVMPMTSASVYAKWVKVERSSGFNVLDFGLKSNDINKYKVEKNTNGSYDVSVIYKSTYEMFSAFVPVHAKQYSYFELVFTGTKDKVMLLKCQNGGVTAVETKVTMTGEKQTFTWRVNTNNLTDGSKVMNFYMCLDAGVEHKEGTNPDISINIESIMLYRGVADGTAEHKSINFVTDGGSVVETIFEVAGNAITAPTCTKDGFTFGGWYSDTEFTTPYTFSTMPNENIVLYANWVAV